MAVTSLRRTLLTATAAALLGTAWWVSRPGEDAPGPAATTTSLLRFDRAALVRVAITRTDGTLALEEGPHGWRLAGTDHRASDSMVSRVKHQLHDLDARATVVADTDDPARYGLGASATHVALTLRDGRTLGFRVGDPNPTGVSVYLRRDGDPAVYTVKKSAVDYYALSFDEFRERRFLELDSASVQAVEASLGPSWGGGGSTPLRNASPGEPVVRAFRRAGPTDWEMTAPLRMDADPDAVATLLGQLGTLRAERFGPDVAPPESGLDHPRARIRLTLDGRSPRTLQVGARAEDASGGGPLAWMRLDGEPGTFLAREELLTGWDAEPATFRLRRFMQLDAAAVSGLRVTLRAAGPDSKAGTVTLARSADTWTWEDGHPVPGDTPARLVRAATALEARAFVDNPSAGVRRCFDTPGLVVTLMPADGTARTLELGCAGPAETAPGEDGPRTLPRWYARRADAPSLYLVDDSALATARDLLREHARKAEGQAATEQRRARNARDAAP
jgi:hypothetical protein